MLTVLHLPFPAYRACRLRLPAAPAYCLTAAASREKVRLTDELKRAELTVARCKEVIRQAARYCQEVPAGEVCVTCKHDLHEAQLASAVITKRGSSLPLHTL